LVGECPGRASWIGGGGRARGPSAADLV
jgi:hypothetical protein